jgi:hypothetical protein
MEADPGEIGVSVSGGSDDGKAQQLQHAPLPFVAADASPRSCGRA